MDPTSNNDWTPLTDLSGADAVAAYAKIINGEDEVTAECRYTGKNTMTVKLGKSTDGHGYAFIEDSESGQRLITSSEADIEVLCQNWISFLGMRQGFTNSDPRSPDHFDVEPYLEDLVSALNNKFGINVQLDY